MFLLNFLLFRINKKLSEEFIKVFYDIISKSSQYVYGNILYVYFLLHLYFYIIRYDNFLILLSIILFFYSITTSSISIQDLNILLFYDLLYYKSYLQKNMLWAFIIKFYFVYFLMLICSTLMFLFIYSFLIG